MVPFYTIVYAVKEVIRNRGTILAASLAFVTALSIVPLLSVVVSVLAAFGNFAEQGSALEPYIQQVVPAAAADIAGYLEKFATSSAAEVAGIGAIAFFVIGFFLFIAIERLFNIVWASEKQRPWLQKGFAFISLMTFGPLMLSVSVALSSRAQFQFSQFGVDVSVFDRLLPFGLTMLLFWAMNHFLPTANVRWWASLLGGAFSAVAFELGKWGFNVYVTEVILVPYNQMYGALGLFPLFLVWLYVIWIIVLVGAELAYCSQNLQTLVSVRTATARSPGRHGGQIFNPLVGLELYAPIARAFKSGEGRISERDLVTQTGYAESVIRAVVSQLDSIGALEIVEDEDGERRLLPSKQLDDIQILPIVTNFFDFDAEPNSLPFARLLEGYHAVTLEALRSESALSLIPQDTELSQKYSAVRPWEPLPSGLSESSSSAYEPPAEDASPEPAPSLAALSEPDVGDVPAMEKETTRPVQADDSSPPPGVEGSGESIQIHTQDILVEESDPELPLANTEVTPETRKKNEQRKKPGQNQKKKARTKDSSIEIDIAGMWDDFEVDSYAEILEAANEELEKTDFDEPPGELGNEKSVPPPVPKGKKNDQ